MATDFSPSQWPQPPGAAPRPAPRGRAPCSTYTLRYEDDAFGIEKRVEFEAISPAYALEIARGEAEGRRALLLENGRPLCRLEKAAPGEAPFWILATRPQPGGAAHPLISTRGMNDGQIDTRQDPGSQGFEGRIAGGL